MYPYCLRSALLLALIGLALTASSCGEGNGTDQGWYPGQTEFTNNEPGSYGYGRDYSDGAPMAGASEDANSKTATPPGPPQGRTGTVEEADIYKVDQNRLFYLNTYRGFIIYDLADPKNPQLLSRLPVYGYPIEMFIQKNTVYALIRDALYLTQTSGKLQFERHNVSQLVAIDISDLKNPKVMQTVDIIGELREGVSRKIDDTVYVVSYRDQNYWNGWGYYYTGPVKEKEQAWVYAFNVADPKNLKLVDQLKVFEGGSVNYHDPNYNTSVHRYFSGVTISATSNALMVAENWYTYGYVSGSKNNCGSSFSQQQAMVSIIDISDPYGKIRLHTKFETYGSLGDQFKQTYVFDPVTKKGTYLGILARQEWSSSSCQGSSVVQNTLESWDITDGGSPKKVDELAFGKPNETVRGSTFDTDRGVAFAITARAIDPLYAISIADPTNLHVLSAIDGLSGDMNVFRFIGDNKFLLAIGQDTSSTCTGFGDAITGWGTGVAVSIIDVQDLTKIRLVQRKCVAVKNASWVSSELNWNRDQAHKMIGMYSDGKINAITVPVYYYKKTGGDGWYWHGYETAVGLMTWDLTQYDSAKSELEQNVLQNYGTIIHPKGQVRRTIIFNHKTDTERRMVLNLSNTHISLVDIADLANPTLQSMVEVAPYQDQLYKFTFGNDVYVVEHIRPAQYSYYEYGSSSENASEFRVVKVGGGKLEDTKPVATFTVGQVERVLKYKDNLVLFRRVYNTDKTQPYYYSWEAELVVYDLSVPAAPKKAGTLKLPGPIFPYYWYWCGLDTYWGGYWFDYYGGNNFIVTERGISFLSNLYSYDYNTKKSTYSRKLTFVDLANTSSPTLKQVTLTSANTWTFFSLIPDPTDAKSFFLSYRTKVGEVFIDGATFYQYKYFAQRWAWNGADWVSDYAVNVPGQLMKTWTSNGKRMFLTYDYTYKKMSTPNSKWASWQHSFRLNLLRQITPWGVPAAQLLDFYNFQSFYLKDVVIDQNNLYVNARHDYYYNSTNNIPWEDVSDQLMIFDLSGLTLAKKYSEPTGTYQVRLMGTHQGKLFVNIPGDGILVVDVSSCGPNGACQPNGLQFARTLGYTTHIEFVNDRALLSAGYFGIYEIDLKAAASIPNT